MVADKGCGVVLGDACAFTLGDGPLAGGVEHGAVQLWVSQPEFFIALHNPIDALLLSDFLFNSSNLSQR